jgi:hypothetical protein
MRIETIKIFMVLIESFYFILFIYFKLGFNLKSPQNLNYWKLCNLSKSLIYGSLLMQEEYSVSLFFSFFF